MAKYGVKEVCNVTFYDLVTDKPVLYLDTLKMSNLETTASTSDARGGQGNPKLLQWDFDREATMAIQDALMTSKSMALLAGNDPTTLGTTEVIHRREEVAIVDNAGVLQITVAKGIVEDGTVTIFKGETDVTAQFETALISEGDLIVEAKTGATGIAAGDKVVAYYQFKTAANAAEKIVIATDKFPGYYKVVGDTVVRNSESGLDEPYQLVLPKTKLQAGFSLTFQADGDPSVFDMNLEVFKSNANTSMVELIKYED